MFEIPDWTTESACLPGNGAPAEADWFADPGTTARRLAEQVCTGCPVKALCSSYREQVKADFEAREIEVMGAWGKANSRPTSTHSWCGTPGGRNRHKRRGESVCAACRAARRPEPGRLARVA